MAVFVVGANLCMLSERYLLGASTYVLIAISSLFRMSISQIEFDKEEFDIPKKGENIIIKKTFFYDGQFKSFINTTDPSRKSHFYTIKKDTEWTLFSIVEYEDDWLLSLENKQHDNISIRYFVSRNHWETKSDKRANRLKQLGI
jgi:hypothetical protein